MEVVGTVMSVAQTLFAALQNAELKEFFTVFGYESQLQELQSTVSRIKAVFRDAETKQSLTEVEQQLIEDLKDVVYEADDLLDEFVTLAEQKQLVKDDGSFSEKLHSFLSGTNRFAIASKMSKGVKKIRKKLDAIVDSKGFSFVHDPEPIRKRKLETCSYVNEGDIIGRGEDLEKIIGRLLDSNDQRDLSFLSIFGIGGLGKTALAQLVYNDPAVKSAFPLRMWTCVADQDQKQLDVLDVLRKTLASATNNNYDEGCTLDNLQRQLREKLKDKRYLLVLDDVWTEEHKQWCELVQYFVGGQRKSWIMVTTRSQRTATIIGDKGCQMYELQGLSKVDSWRLFERASFGPDESGPRDNELDKIGREIVDQCARVPLAIRVIGSLLYRQDKHMWQSVKKSGLANVGKDDIMSILQLSYHHLEAPLKSCFSYCALFPKDFVMLKEMLIDLWMAQGYVLVEDDGEKYFSILLKRCFFQDIKKDKDGEIVSCKMHDLIHDVARSVSVKEIYASNTSNENINEKVRHYSYSISINEHVRKSLYKTHVRSCIYLGGTFMDWVENSFVNELISRCTSLRAVNFFGVKIEYLPDSISTLLHLRYLNLSHNLDLEVLPKPFPKLYNLQTLKLDNCTNLRELPKDLSKLVKLRVLDISKCTKLKYMPTGMDKLACLCRLSDFIVGNEGSFVGGRPSLDGLEDQKVPNSLKGNLKVLIKWSQNGDKIEKRSILNHTEHLNGIIINFKDNYGRIDEEVSIALMEDLHPHRNLRMLKVRYYLGTRMPDWASFLPNLVKLELRQCEKLKEWWGWVRLRVGDASNSSGDQGRSQEIEFSGAKLNLGDNKRRTINIKGVQLTKIRTFDYASGGWASTSPQCSFAPGGDNEARVPSLPCLPQLMSLKIWSCPELTWIPLCPKLELLTLNYFSRRMVFGEFGHALASTTCHKLKEIELDNMAWLNSLPMEAFQCLVKLKINFDEEVERLGEVGEVFRNCSSSLRRLEFRRCRKLRSVVSGELEHLTALEELEFSDCENLKVLEEEKEGEDGGIMSCLYSFLLPSLHTLTLYGLPKLENLPNWMQFLPSLETLTISCCENLKAMPNWMPGLTSIKYLHVDLCSKSLERRCRKDPQGEDWTFIQHIPTIHFERCNYEDEETPQPSNQSNSSDTDTHTESKADVEAEAGTHTNIEVEADTDT